MGPDAIGPDATVITLLPKSKHQRRLSPSHHHAPQFAARQPPPATVAFLSIQRPLGLDKSTALFYVIPAIAPLRTQDATMGLSKSTSIMILLAIDTAFFFLELVVGYAVHSLALVADSFHMVCGVHALNKS